MPPYAGIPLVSQTQRKMANKTLWRRQLRCGSSLNEALQDPSSSMLMTARENRRGTRTQPYTHTRGVKQLNCTCGDGGAAAAALTQRQPGAARTRRAASSHGGLGNERGEADADERKRERERRRARKRGEDDPFHVNCIISLSCPPHVRQTASRAPASPPQSERPPQLQGHITVVFMPRIVLI